MSSASIRQTHYLISMFPAMALVVAKTLGDWLTETRRETLAKVFVGIIMVVAFIIGSTGIELRQASSLRQKSEWTRDLAAVVNLNTPQGDWIGNFKLRDQEEPQTGLNFYGDRYLESPLHKPEELISQIEKLPRKTWLASIEEFKQLQQQYPGNSI